MFNDEILLAFFTNRNVMQLPISYETLCHILCEVQKTIEETGYVVVKSVYREEN